ncbi:DUF3747 domain-containing protein [Aphanothece hegewaldii]|nr:DUF3747 domain-containing protein [Aphanothece hegewaldii]
MTCLVGSSSSVQGVNFEQQEIEQNQLIAIARPYGDHQYDLLILQQIPGKQQCWSEIGSNPVTVDPLLLNFDFTGSCERSTDPNGYSIRIDGQDYGMEYLLRLVMRNNELFLIGTSRNNAKKPDVIVGRTNGIAPGLLKINLNPGWRFSKRAYQGKALGHVYLTGNSQAIASINMNILNAANPTPRSSSSSSSIKPPKELTFTAEGTKPQPPVMPALPPKSSPSSLRPLPPVPSLPETNNSQPPLRPLPLVPSLPETNNSQPPLPPPLPSVASTTNNSSSRKTLSDTLSNLSGTPTPTVAQSPPQSRYKVIVPANNSELKSQVRSLYPDAFPTSYKGSSVLQIGVFSTQDKAKQALQSLTSAGIKGQIIAAP